MQPGDEVQRGGVILFVEADLGEPGEVAPCAANRAMLVIY